MILTCDISSSEETTESAAQLKGEIPDYGMKENKKEAHVGNKNYGVGGTA